MPSQRAKAYSELHRSYLKDIYLSVFRKLEAEGVLEEHLQRVGREAEKQFHLVSDQLARRAPQEPKARQEHLESIAIAADEIVRSDSIYRPWELRA